jgi:hypothetical protein
VSTLDKIREAHRARRKAVKVAGVEVSLAPISAAAAMALQKRHADKAGTTDDDPALLELWIDTIAATARDDSGLVFDSDDGRELLRELSLDELADIGGEALLMAGLARAKDEADAKKN